MTDIHTHILPGVDDGAETLEQSLKMLAQAYEDGTDTVVLTPHGNIPGTFVDTWNDELESRFLTLKSEAQKYFPLRIFKGMEVFATNDLGLLIDQKKVITLNDSQYMLVEFDFEEEPAWIGKILGEIKSRGLVPIIAHPERYLLIQACPPILYDWICDGALSQVNKDSILGKFGGECSRTARVILNHNLAQFVASDAHTHIARTAKMHEARNLVGSFFSYDYAQLLFNDNPLRAVNNEPVFVPEPLCPPM